MTRRIALSAAALALPLAVAGTAAAAPACNVAKLPLKTKGQLTVGTDNPAFGPWFGGGTKSSFWQVNDPSTGKGFESAVAYAVAKRMGFTRAQVKWVYTPFNKSFAPGPKSFDLFINQVSINAQRARQISFTSPYYNVNQAVVGVKGKPITKVRTVSGLKPFRLGAQVGTTSLDTISNRIQPSQSPRVFNTNALAVQALKSGQIDGIVVDLPTAYFVTAVQVPNGKIVGQLKPQGAPEQFGMVAQKGSGVVGCTNRAIGQLKKAGTLKRLEQKWLAGASAPFLK